MTRTADISAGQLRAYLERHGWEEIGRGFQGSTWRLPSSDEHPAVLIPEDTANQDASTMVAAAVSRLAWSRGKTEADIVEELRTTCDAIEVRVKDPTTNTGRIGLERGAQLVESLRQVVWNGARLHFSGGRVGYSGDLPDKARAVVDQLELAPPAAGSFKLELYAPATTQLSLDSADAPDDPVHETLVSTMLAIDAARMTAERTEIPEEPDELSDAVALGVSTNLLNAIIKLDTQSPSLLVEFNARWSKPEPRAPETVALEPRHFAKLPVLRDVLAQKDPKQDFPLYGWIKGVQVGDLALDQELAGVAIVVAKIDAGVRDIHVTLRGDDVRAAREGIGERFLSAVGTLQKIGRDWHLTEPRGIAVRQPREIEPG